jgi:hypothetical protein
MIAFKRFNTTRLSLLLWFLTLPLTPYPLPFIPLSAQTLPTQLDSAIFTRDVIAEVAPIVETLRAPVYRLELTLSDDLLSLEGTANVFVTNTSDDVWNEIVFRLYPNALGSDMRVTETRVNNVEVATELAVKNTVLRVPVSLEPNVGTIVILHYTLELSAEVHSYGRLAKYQDVLSLSHAYPTLSVYQRSSTTEGTWLEDFPPDLADPLVAEVSLFDVRIEAPKEWQLVTTGQIIQEQTTTNRQTVQAVTGPARDFYIAATLNYEKATRQVGETTLRVFTPQKFSQSASSVLETSARALTLFSELYTPYPCKEFDIVAIPVGAGGIEYPGIVVITNGLFAASGKITSVLAHEVAHQWSFNLVGSDQINSPWLDESLTQYLTWRFQKEVNPRFIKGYETYWQTIWEQSSDETLPIDLPVSVYNKSDYAGIIYGKGLFFFKALAAAIGQENFDAALKGYFEQYAWQFVSQRELESWLERSCTCELSAVFADWVK